MDRRLISTVYVLDEHDAPHAFGPGDVVPAWAAEKITNPDVWASPDVGDGGAPGVPVDGEPPRNGKGSGLVAWIEYAESIGVDVDEDASRDDVIASVDAHNAAD